MTALAEQDLPPLLENGNRPPGLIPRLKDIWAYRELMVNLIRRELKVRYKDSVLGFLWTLLNPLLYLAVFSIVFGLILPNSVPRFGMLLLSGLLAFNLFSVGLSAATTSVTGNGPLVQKVWFPREILPLAAIGANLITFFFQLTILVLGLVFFQQSPEWSMLWLTIPALIVTLMIATGLGLMLSAVNVHFRDVQHFLELGLLTWFWMTPIVYAYDFPAKQLNEKFGEGAERWTMINPMTSVITTFQRVVYNPTNFSEEQQTSFTLLLDKPTSWFLGNLAMSGAVGLVLLYAGFRVFTRLESNLGEEL